jgi:hypothetical protein
MWLPYGTGDKAPFNGARYSGTAVPDVAFQAVAGVRHSACTKAPAHCIIAP